MKPQDLLREQLLREALVSYYWVLRAQVVDAQTSGKPAGEVQRLQEKRDLCATLKREANLGHRDATTTLALSQFHRSTSCS